MVAYDTSKYLYIFAFNYRRCFDIVIFYVQLGARTEMMWKHLHNRDV